MWGEAIHLCHRWFTFLAVRGMHPVSGLRYELGPAPTRFLRCARNGIGFGPSVEPVVSVTRRRSNSDVPWPAAALAEVLESPWRFETKVGGCADFIEIDA